MATTLIECYEHFLADMADLRQLGPNTIRAYRYELAAAAGDRQFCCTLDALTLTILERWLVRPPAAPSTISRRAADPEGASEADLKKRTLTNLYNERPTWLDLAHRKLDQAVFDAYGWPHDIRDDDLLSRLLALNLERAAKQGAIAGTITTNQDSDHEES